MLCDPEFDSKEVYPDLHKRMEKAVEDGYIKCFNMREGPADGDQDLNFWAREFRDVVMEDPIMEDPKASIPLLLCCIIYILLSFDFIGLFVLIHLT